jgi:hypothetical protein
MRDALIYVFDGSGGRDVYQRRPMSAANAKAPSPQEQVGILLRFSHA